MRALLITLFTSVFIFTLGFHGCCPTKESVLREIVTEYQNNYILEYDTIYTPIVTRDSVIHTDSILIDRPVSIEKDKLVIRVVRLGKDTIRVTGTCKPDTIIKEIKSIQVKPPAVAGRTPWYQWVSYIFGFIGFLTILGGVFKLFKK